MTCKTCTNVSLTNSWQEVDTALQANHVLDSLTDQQWAACSLSRYVTFLKSRITYDPLLSTWDLASVTLDDKIVTHCLFPTSRTVFPAAVAGLDFAWSSSGDVCQQPSKWPHYFCWPHPAELLVGSQRLCGHPLCHNFCPYSTTEQVWTNWC